ncbi:MAG: hypothetical protein DMG03_15165 [Acidobacteria bacterium]|nr:MAG: hypothetical protein DMG03_15165 [Acidobacteriota bacterium]
MAALLCLLLFVIAASVARAQTVSTTAGAINGTVTDTTHAVLPGVTIALSGPAVMGAPTTVTDQNGFFRLPGLAPGDYQLTFELSGFGPVTRAGIHVSLGFTATVNVEMSPGSVAETITVSGASPVVDLQATNVTTHFDTERLASLPGSRDFWAVVAQTPAVSMSRVDVGGSGALTQQAYTAYGLTSGGGVNRGVVEGIMVNEGAGGGGSDLCRRQHRGDAESRRAQPVHHEVGRQHLPRHALRRLRERCDGVAQHRRVADCRRRDGQQRLVGVRYESAQHVQGLQRRPRRVRCARQDVVVRRLSADDDRTALSDAGRRRAGHVGAGRHRQGHVQLLGVAEVHRVLPARRQVSARLPGSDSNPRRPHDARHHARRCRLELSFSDQRVEGRIQLGADQRAAARSAGRHVSLGVVANEQEPGAACGGHRQQLRLRRRVRHQLHPQPSTTERFAQLLEGGMGRQSQLQGRRRDHARQRRESLLRIHERDQRALAVRERIAEPGVRVSVAVILSERRVDRRAVRQRHVAAEEAVDAQPRRPLGSPAGVPAGAGRPRRSDVRRSPQRDHLEQQLGTANRRQLRSDRRREDAREGELRTVLAVSRRRLRERHQSECSDVVPAIPLDDRSESQRGVGSGRRGRAARRVGRRGVDRARPRSAEHVHAAGDDLCRA